MTTKTRKAKVRPPATSRKIGRPGIFHPVSEIAQDEPGHHRPDIPEPGGAKKVALVLQPPLQVVIPLAAISAPARVLFLKICSSTITMPSASVAKPAAMTQ